MTDKELEEWICDTPIEEIISSLRDREAKLKIAEEYFNKIKALGCDPDPDKCGACYAHEALNKLRGEG